MLRSHVKRVRPTVSEQLEQEQRKEAKGHTRVTSYSIERGG